MWQKVWTNRCPLKLRMASVSLEWVGAKSQPENGFRTIDWPTPYSVLPKAALRCCSGGTFGCGALWLLLLPSVENSPEGPGSKQRPSAQENSLGLNKTLQGSTWKNTEEASPLHCCHQYCTDTEDKNHSTYQTLLLVLLLPNPHQGELGIQVLL